MQPQVLQTYNLPSQKGVITQAPAHSNMAKFNYLISPNETNDVVVGAYVEIDETITDGKYIKLASATTPKHKVYMVFRASIGDHIDGTSQGNAIDINGRLVKERNIILLFASTPVYYYNEVNDAVAVNDLLMIDDTDPQKARLIPFVDAGGNVAIGQAVKSTTAGGQVTLINNII